MNADKQSKEYRIVYEESRTGWGAYVPDLPGLGVVGSTFNEVQILIREGIKFHLEGIRQRAIGERRKARARS
jgi:predicted RNase H-like HicB family nuclease